MWRRYRREHHVWEVDEGFGVKSSINGKSDGRKEEKVAQAEEEGRGQEVDLGRGVRVVGAAPALVTWKSIENL